MTYRSDLLPQGEISASFEDCTAVQLPLGNVLPLLIDAVKNNHGWLDDFIDEEVIISRDLYDVLRFFGQAQHPAAGNE